MAGRGGHLISGAHSIIYSTSPEADRAFLRDSLGLPHVDVGGGWLIFGLPPSEVAIHPADDSGRQELFLLCDDVGKFVGEMRKQEIACSPVATERWGYITRVTLPGGGTIGVSQPRHARPPTVAAQARRAKAALTKRSPAKRVRKSTR